MRELVGQRADAHERELAGKPDLLLGVNVDPAGCGVFDELDGGRGIAGRRHEEDPLSVVTLLGPFEHELGTQAGGKERDPPGGALRSIECIEASRRNPEPRKSALLLELSAAVASEDNAGTNRSASRPRAAPSARQSMNSFS